jgi:cellulose synthase/poly-beta-1,6-N-acetylglucosamine synthase-like glycosyltransferase
MIYFSLANGTYFVLMVAGVRDILKKRKLANRLGPLSKKSHPVSIVAPAFNMEQSILASVGGLLRLDYADYEVMIVNDGSSDRTFELLKENYDLVLEEMNLATVVLCRGKIRGLYQSKKNPRLRVLDKENRGNKADALNAGVSYARHELFCAVDADSLLEKDALTRIVQPFVRDFDRVVAGGGTIRVINGSEFRDGSVRDAKVSYHPLVLFQIIEYLRAFYTGRTGWNRFNSLLVISGAFGIFKTSAVKAIGGYSDSAIGEDMELVTRLHRFYRARKIDYSIEFVPEATCWTEVPSTVHGLYVQRNRWQRGLLDSLMQNRGMFLNARYGMIAFLAIPYFIFVELLGPIFELLIWIVIFIAERRGIIGEKFLIEMIVVSLLVSWFFSFCGIFVERFFFARYVKLSNYFKLILGTLFEPFGYGQITALWRVIGVLDYIRGNKKWGKIKRKGFDF